VELPIDTDRGEVTLIRGRIAMFAALPGRCRGGP